MTPLVLTSLTPLLAIPVAYLVLRFIRSALDRPDERQWAGHGIDTQSVAQRVAQVRHDYLSELHLRPGDARKCRGLVACAGRKVGGLPYFRSRQTLTAAPAHEEPRST
jgi:hypothetical protein